jgi:hypothetical protein
MVRKDANFLGDRMGWEGLGWELKDLGMVPGCR